MPFLKKIKLLGFKSFAYKTELNFKGGVVGIVGPNGCGKSNIVDSLKWGFGEKGSKALRGESVIDIIFAGTEVHKSVGLAEVEIIIDNSDMLLPIKYNEVSIKRKIFRSGETEFYINKNNVRLKDIHDLFADTGVGKGTYSFMEQGRIDQILSSKPDERRMIFEEAAGIAKYKARKKETLSKMESTSKNLDQVNVLLKELENERISLKAQAQKAKVYNEKKAKLKKSEIQLFGNKYKKNKQKLTDVKKKITDLNDKEIKLKTENSSINSEIEKIKDMIFKFEQMKNEFEKKRLTYEERTKANNEKINMLKSLCDKNSNEIKLKTEQIDNITKENEKIEKNITLLKKELEKFKREQGENEKKLIKIRDKRKNLQERKILNIGRKDELKTEIDINTNKVEELRIDLRNVTDRFVAQIDKKKKELEGSQKGRVDLTSEVEKLLNNIIKELRGLSSEGNKIKPQEIAKEVDEVKKIIGEFLSLQDEFRNLIFDEKGPYAKKEKIDQRINKLLRSIIASQKKISMIESENEQFTKQISELTERYNELDKAKNDMKHYISNNNKEINNNKDSLIKNKSYYKDLDAEIKNIQNSTNGLKSQIDGLNNQIDKYMEQSDDINKKILKYQEDMNEKQGVILKRKGIISKLVKGLETMERAIKSQMELKYGTEAQLNESKLHLYNEFNVKVSEIVDTIPGNIDEKEINKQINRIKTEIKDLGHVNLLAEELYEDVDKRYKFHVEQKKDLTGARDDLMKIIETVNKESASLFLDTFNQIRKNFHNIFRQIFQGGKADLILVEPDNLLESGIEIYAQPPGKKVNSYEWLSGGERSLLAIGLMFAIFQVKPSPFCVLDEVDAALDEENNARFLMMMKEFLKNTQFLVITHNKQTIVNCDYLYGVTMEEKGISKVISLELKKEKIDDYIK